MRLFRPPAEAYSLIIRIMQGCPWNQCTFCGMYKDVPFQILSDAQIDHEINQAAEEYPHAKRIFLADGDVMQLPYGQLKSILEQLNARFPKLARINLYANGSSILSKTSEELNVLRKLKLNTLYMGLESGDEETLKRVHKRESANEMSEAAHKAQDAGLKMSVMILTGLGGKKNREMHVVQTAEALNKMQPRILSALRVIPIPGTTLFTQEESGQFQQLSELEAMEELRDLIARLELKSTVFRANHSSNILPMEGRFPKDQTRLTAELTTLINSGTLDRRSPGPPPLSL